MPKEFTQLQSQKPPADLCLCNNKTGCMNHSRGLIQSIWRKWLGLPYCAVICDYTKEIIGWEKPNDR